MPGERRSITEQVGSKSKDRRPSPREPKSGQDGLEGKIRNRPRLGRRDRRTGKMLSTPTSKRPAGQGLHNDGGDFVKGRDSILNTTVSSTTRVMEKDSTDGPQGSKRTKGQARKRGSLVGMMINVFRDSMGSMASWKAGAGTETEGEDEDDYGRLDSKFELCRQEAFYCKSQAGIGGILDEESSGEVEDYLVKKSMARTDEETKTLSLGRKAHAKMRRSFGNMLNEMKNMASRGAPIRPGIDHEGDNGRLQPGHSRSADQEDSTEAKGGYARYAINPMWSKSEENVLVSENERLREEVNEFLKSISREEVGCARYSVNPIPGMENVLISDNEHLVSCSLREKMARARNAAKVEKGNPLDVGGGDRSGTAPPLVEGNHVKHVNKEPGAISLREKAAQGRARKRRSLANMINSIRWARAVPADANAEGADGNIQGRQPSAPKPCSLSETDQGERTNLRGVASAFNRAAAGRFGRHGSLLATRPSASGAGPLNHHTYNRIERSGARVRICGEGGYDERIASILYRGK